MNKSIKSDYSFCDIFIFRKTATGYISVTDFNIEHKLTEDDEYKFPFTDPFLIGLPAADDFLIARITIEEIIQLAGQSPTSVFIRQCRSRLDTDAGNDIVAIICSLRLIDYNYGKIKLSPDSDHTSYKFYRRKVISQKPYRQTHKHFVLEKNFKKVIL